MGAALRARHILEVKLECLRQMSKCLLNGGALARNFDLDTPSYVPVAITPDDGA